MNDATTIGNLEVWLDTDGDLRVAKWEPDGPWITRDEAAKLWPLIRRFAETGRLTVEVKP